MIPSSYISFAKSSLFSSVLVLALVSCSKENIEPTASASASSTSSIIKKETVMPIVTDHRNVDGGINTKQTKLSKDVSIETDPISDPGMNDRFKQVSNDDEISTEARPGPGTRDESIFRQIKSTKKYSAATESKPGRETGRFRKIRLSKDLSIN